MKVCHEPQSMVIKELFTDMNRGLVVTVMLHDLNHGLTVHHATPTRTMVSNTITLHRHQPWTGGIQYPIRHVYWGPRICRACHARATRVLVGCKTSALLPRVLNCHIDYY